MRQGVSSELTIHAYALYKWADLFASPIEYAQKGFPVSTSLNYWSEVNVDPADTEFRDLQRFPEFASIFLKD